MAKRPVRRSRLILAYAAPFLLLGLVVLAGLNWHVAREYWYCHKYERTQNVAYREKLEKLGEQHPDLAVSRWFYLLANLYTNDHYERMRDLPPEVHRRALGLWLRERFSGKWWDGRVSKFYPLEPLDDKYYWLPHVPLLRDALQRLPQPPPAPAVYGIDLYMASRALAICGDDTGLPYLEDMLLEDVNVYPYDPAGIADHSWALSSIVALAANGSRRARKTVEKGLARLRVRGAVVRQMEALLKRETDCSTDDLRWLAKKLAAYEAQCAAEKKLAGERYAKLAAEVRRSSFMGCAVVSGRGGYDFFGTHMLAARLSCATGTVFAEKLRVDNNGNWWLQRAQIPFEDYASLWKEVLEFDLWNLPEEDETHRRGGPLTVFRAGKRSRRLERSALHWDYREPDRPSTWPHAWIEAHFKKSPVKPLTGKLALRSLDKNPDESWLRGEAWPPAEKGIKPSGPKGLGPGKPNAP